MIAVFCFALGVEAKPFIELGKCKLLFQQKDLKYYKGKDFNCLVTGIGRIRMATAIGWLSGFEQQEKCLFNIGLAGSVKLQKHTWHFVCKVTDELTGKDFYPEIIKTYDLPIQKLTSVMMPANSNKIKQLQTDLVDMEGYAFCKSAQQFLPTTHIHLIKFVSDEGSEHFSFTNWLEYYNNSIAVIAEKCLSILTYITQTQNKYNTNVQHLIDLIEAKIKLTFSQKVQLRNALIFQLNTHGESHVKKLLNDLPEAIKQKEQRNIIVEQLLNKLHHA
ncbi:MAG: hypothetical protein ACK4K9_00250 [Bacteroidia bacterium]